LLSIAHSTSLRTLKIVQTVVASLMLVIVVLLHVAFKPYTFSLGLGLLLAALVGCWFIVPGKAGKTINQQIGFTMVITAIIVNLYFNWAFYPALLRYQAGSEAAFYLNKNNTKHLPVAQYLGDYAYPLEFYLDAPLYNISDGQQVHLPPKPFLLYVSANDVPSLRARGWDVQPVKTFERYWITKLKPKFINAATRPQTLEYMQLVLVR
jgi:hypothetical protein